MTKIFISYRRDDSQHQTDRLHAVLKRHVPSPEKDIFLDIDGIPLGVDFAAHLQEKVQECDVLLAVIGPGWVSARDPNSGARRLDSPQDFVRLEIAAALKRDIRVVPVLLDGARVPLEHELPDDLRDLSRRNGIELRRVSFERDAERLVQKLIPDTVAASRLHPAAKRASLIRLSGPGIWLTAIVTALAASMLWLAQAGLIGGASTPGRSTAVVPVAQAGRQNSNDAPALSPVVQAAVLEARKAETLAIAAANQARVVARLADEAAARARGGSIGTITGSDALRHWESEGRGNTVRQGYGVLWTTAGDFAGDSYRGEWVGNVRSGHGVYAFAENLSNRNPDGSIAMLQYEGQYLDGKRHGVGVSTWRSGKTYAGELREAKQDGVGVARFEDGSVYEGEWKADTFQGLGVWWNPDGTIRKAGNWANGQFAGDAN